MDVYDFVPDSDSSDSEDSVFGGFDPSDIAGASPAQLVINRKQLSSISSESSSSSESESDSNDTNKSVHNPIDLCADPPEWSIDLVPIQVPPFNSQSGPNLPNNWDTRSSPFKYFQLFFTPDIIQDIVMYTNSYDELSIKKKRETFPTFQDKQWSLDGSNNINLEEMWAYLGCCFILSVNPSHQLKHVFTTDPYMYNHGLRHIFTLRRFTKIGQYICIYDKKNEPPHTSPQYQKTYKFSKIVDHLNMTFPKFYKYSEFQVIDESVVKTKCHLQEIHYCPNKPGWRGLKIWCRCDSKNSTSCYLYQFMPYMGKKHTQVSKSGLYVMQQRQEECLLLQWQMIQCLPHRGGRLH